MGSGGPALGRAMDQGLDDPDARNRALVTATCRWARSAVEGTAGFVAELPGRRPGQGGHVRGHRLGRHRPASRRGMDRAGYAEGGLRERALREVARQWSPVRSSGPPTGSGTSPGCGSGRGAGGVQHGARPDRARGGGSGIGPAESGPRPSAQAPRGDRESLARIGPRRRPRVARVRPIPDARKAKLLGAAGVKQVAPPTPPATGPKPTPDLDVAGCASGPFRWRVLASTSLASFTSSAISKSNMPARTKSAPFWNANRNAFFGGIAPAAMVLKAIHGFFTDFMKSAVSFGWLHQ